MADASIDNLGRWLDSVMQQVTTTPNIYPFDAAGNQIWFTYHNVTIMEIMTFAAQIQIATASWSNDLYRNNLTVGTFTHTVLDKPSRRSLIILPQVSLFIVY